MPKGVYYRVRCTVPVVAEMVRYDGSVLQSARDPKITSGDKPVRDSIKWQDACDLAAQMTTWEFVLFGNPVVARWASFGVSVSYDGIAH